MDNGELHRKINKNLERFLCNLQVVNKDDDSMHGLFIIIFNILFLVRKIIKFFYTAFDEYIIYNTKYKKQMSIILTELNENHTEIIDKYNKLYLVNKSIKYKDLIKNYSLTNKFNMRLMNSNIVHKNTNLDILDIANISKLINHNTNKSNDINSIEYNYVNLGYDNLYKLHIFNSLDDNIPFNLLVYVKEIDQIVMKIGNEKKFQYINSKLYKTYNIKNRTDNGRSILCNNNIRKLNKKCTNGVNCTYYHDIILGHKDNAHNSRQFSCNPIIYDCINFKDGPCIKENIKKIDWRDAITLYQSNLSCILIACMHSTK